MVTVISDSGQVSDTEKTPQALASLMHPDRFAPFLTAANGDPQRAVNLYAWNIEVSSAFWGSFHMLEVSLRNTLHARLSQIAGKEEWWTTDLPIHNFERKQINDALQKVAKSQTTPTPGHVIAELNFGFWVGLLANNYHAGLWVNTLEFAFPNYSGLRRDLHFKLERLRKLRNRIAHHEPIYGRDLKLDYEMICFIIDYISPEISIWVKTLSRVSDVLSNKTSRVDGSSKLSF